MLNDVRVQCSNCAANVEVVTPDSGVTLVLISYDCDFGAAWYV